MLHIVFLLNTQDKLQILLTINLYNKYTQLTNTS